MKFAYILFMLPIFAWAQDFKEPKNANEVWSEMTEAGVTEHERRTYIKGTEAVVAEGAARDAGQYVMFGGEKEGSSALISRIMGPNKEFFKQWVSQLPEENRKKFLSDLLTGLSTGRTRARDVKNAEGVVQNLDLTGIKGQNFASMSDAALTEKFDLFLERSGDKSFSFLTPSYRMKVMNGTVAGLDSATGLKKYAKDGYGYSNFRPIYGDAEKFIDAAHNTSTGWEINFIPQKSYGEFEHMIGWFKNTLKNAGQLFEAPGHQWIVYPKTKAMLESTEESARVIERVNEIHKNNQAYIVLKAIEGDAGIQYSNYKSVHNQTQWKNGLEEAVEGVYQEPAHSTGRGVIRLENNRFQVDDADSLAIEFRAGTKNDNVRRNTQRFLISRYAAQEFDDLAPAKSWTLNKSDVQTPEVIAKRFNVSLEEATKFLENISTATINKGYSYNPTRSINQSYLVPLWSWEEAPYLSKAKKAEVKQLTEAFIKTVARLPGSNALSIQEAMKSWAHTSRLSSDIENYLKPKPQISGSSAVAQIDLPDNARVNVNEVDVGIEYTARFPTKTSAEYTHIPNQPGKMEWLRTSYEYSKEERREVLKRAAQSLAKEQNAGKFTAVSLVDGGDGHGHGLDVAYEFKDAQDRKWRVEWDGIGRSYDSAGNMIPESLRGGHIEIVTPKFNPTEKEMAGVFRALDRESLIPATRFGGGHVNVDLKPFEGNPKALARFLGTYYDSRNMMTLMFQHPGRGVGAEPNRASASLIQKLKTFDGSEADLKKLLYNEKFFNTRVGRKTKNNQLNMIAYFQDAIPEEFIHEDFDMKNDMWRRTFDVNPKIRKMEFRLFNAPRNAAESALQIKFVRAMMNKALNENTGVFNGNYEVNINKLAENPETAMQEFDKLMRDLHLDPAEYRPFLTEGLALTKAHMNNPAALSNEEKLALHPEVSDWGHAAEPRSVAIGSEGRHWAGNDVLPEARQWKQHQLEARRVAEQARRSPGITGRVSKLTVTGGDSIVSGSRCRTAASVVEDLLQE
jgi:hypothetical protein